MHKKLWLHPHHHHGSLVDGRSEWRFFQTLVTGVKGMAESRGISMSSLLRPIQFRQGNRWNNARPEGDYNRTEAVKSSAFHSGTP